LQDVLDKALLTSGSTVLTAFLSLSTLVTDNCGSWFLYPGAVEFDQQGSTRGVWVPWCLCQPDWVVADDSVLFAVRLRVYFWALVCASTDLLWMLWWMCVLVTYEYSCMAWPCVVVHGIPCIIMQQPGQGWLLDAFAQEVPASCLQDAGSCKQRTAWQQLPAYPKACADIVTI
jgi:hypothetical protein